MDNQQAGTAVDKLPGEKTGAVRPSVSEAKQTAQQTRRVDGRGVKAGQSRGPYKKTGAVPGNQPATIEPEIPAFTWEKKDVSLILGSPFTFGYAMGGPDHEHWREVGEGLEKSQCYDKLTYVVNRLGIRDPMYLVLAVGLVEYLGAIGKCGAASLKIHREKIAKEQADAKRKAGDVPAL